VFLITTQPANSGGIAAARKRLGELGYAVTVVEGIKGAELKAGDYFQQTLFWRSRTGHLMTPGELGCALSHQKALRLAADTPGTAHLILEDDFEASDHALAWIRSVSDQVPERALLHLGGQEGLSRFYRYLRAATSARLPEAAHLRVEDLQFLYRTVAYMVDRSTAAAMAALLEDGAFVIDDFHYMHTKGAIESVLFRWVVSHPIDLQASNIEQERGQTSCSRGTSHWSLKSWMELTNRRRMQWALAKRKLSTPRSAFLLHQQTRNQLSE
jgi:glycosyl transferase family 25